MKKFRVVFRKNNGHGKRERIYMDAKDLTALEEILVKEMKAGKKPMRVAEVDDTKTVTTKFKVKMAGNGDIDIEPAKERAKTGAKKTAKATVVKKVTSETTEGKMFVPIKGDDMISGTIAGTDDDTDEE